MNCHRRSTRPASAFPHHQSILTGGTVPVGIRKAEGYIPALFLLFLVGISQSSTGPLLPLFDKRYSSGAAGVPYLITAFFTGCLAAMVISSAVRSVGRRTLPLATALYAAGCAGIYLSGSLAAGLLGCALAGFGAGTVVLTVNSAFARQANGVSLVNLLNGVFALGTVLGPLLAGASLKWGRPYGFLVAALGALLCFRVSRVTAWGPREEPADGGAPKALGRNALAVFLLLYLGYGGLETGIGAWAAKDIQSQGHSAAAAASIVAVFWGATAVSKFGAVALARRVPTAGLVITGLAGTSVFLFVASLPHGAVAGYLLAGLALGPVFPSGLAWIAQRGGDRRSVGLAIAASMSGSVLFPTAIGWFVATDIRAVPLGLAFIGACATLAAVGAHRTRRTPLAPPQRTAVGVAASD
ncbi:MFS transporter [Kitasatospora sp. NPDC002551]|uniref:MFS transporter n=1 Tax=Kitasatospora sp. NPDC002551 TaxID=3154539 RepID=UPI00332B7A04